MLFRSNQTPSDAISQGADDLVARDRRQTPGHHLKSDRCSQIASRIDAPPPYHRTLAHRTSSPVPSICSVAASTGPSALTSSWAPRLMREAIRRHQTPSERPSEATRQSPDEVGNQTPSEVIRGHEAAMGVVLGDSRFSKRSSGPPARSGMKKRCRESSSTAPLDACTTVEL